MDSSSGGRGTKPITAKGLKKGEEDATQQGALGDFGLSEVQGGYLPEQEGRWIDLQVLSFGLPD
jgi:hypothetical protein